MKKCLKEFDIVRLAAGAPDPVKRLHLYECNRCADAVKKKKREIKQERQRAAEGDMSLCRVSFVHGSIPPIRRYNLVKKRKD